MQWPIAWCMKRITAATVRATLPKRRPETQKWDYGHSLVIAGSRGLFGAAVLTVKAALRGGAGLVTLAAPKSLQTLIYTQALEALTLPLEETPGGVIDIKASETIKAYIRDRGVTAITIGPGLTRQAGPFINDLVSKVDLPMVLDADAITSDFPINPIALRCLTPHRREFGRLVGCTQTEFIKNGLKLATVFALKNPSVILVLKGHKSRIFCAHEIWENTTGNPGMAKGGSGDVLSGLMGSFFAQCGAAKNGASSKEYMQAAASAVFLHGLAGDLARKALSETAMNAQDIINYLAPAIKITLKR